MRIQREIDLILRRAHAAIGYAELEVWRATTDEAKAEANAALAKARSDLYEAVFTARCHVRNFLLTPYLPGYGPAFRLTAIPEHWEFYLLPVEAAPMLLAEGDDYPVSQGHAMPYDDPKTIGSLLAFLVAYHPDSGSGAITHDQTPPYWAGQDALDRAAPHLDVIDMAARDLEHPSESYEMDDTDFVCCDGCPSPLECADDDCCNAEP
jgi:hypothetical protein